MLNMTVFLMTVMQGLPATDQTPIIREGLKIISISFTNSIWQKGFAMILCWFLTIWRSGHNVTFSKHLSKTFLHNKYKTFFSSILSPPPIVCTTPPWWSWPRRPQWRGWSYWGSTTRGGGVWLCPSISDQSLSKYLKVYISINFGYYLRTNWSKCFFRWLALFTFSSYPPIDKQLENLEKGLYR